MITVVIPYYQREPGILLRALSSVQNQDSCGFPIHVIIVDDASPVSAADEINALDGPKFSIKLIRQDNKGPGGARNTGLDHVPKNTRYLAFLDSDDEWEPNHLKRAVSALVEGYDFYFSNLYHLGQTVSAFERSRRLDVSLHRELTTIEPGIFSYQGDMLDQIIRGNVIGTPTVVYDFQRFSTKRFQVDFANAGEDYLFWMDLTKSKTRIAFSNLPEVRCGKGVNVYSGAGWGTEKHLHRIYDELKYRKCTLRLYALNKEQKLHLAKCIESLWVAFARDLLHRLVHLKKIPVQTLLGIFKEDPVGFLKIPFNWTVFFWGKGVSRLNS